MSHPTPPESATPLSPAPPPASHPAPPLPTGSSTVPASSPSVDPAALAAEEPPREEPRIRVTGAAAGQGELGGASRDPVLLREHDDQPGSSEEEAEVGAGVRGLRLQEGVGAGMQGGGDKAHPPDAGSSDSGSGPGGGGRGYAADASASSSQSAEPVGFASQEPRGPTGSRPRRRPASGEQGCGMLPPAPVKGKQVPPTTSGDLLRPCGTSDDPAVAGDSEKSFKSFTTSSSSAEIPDRSRTQPRPRHPRPTHLDRTGGEPAAIRDQRPSYALPFGNPTRPIQYAQSQSTVLLPPPMHGCHSQRRGGRVSGRAASKLVKNASQEEDSPAAQSSSGDDDTSGTEGWFRTLNYHYRPPAGRSELTPANGNNRFVEPTERTGPSLMASANGGAGGSIGSLPIKDEFVVSAKVSSPHAMDATQLHLHRDREVAAGAESQSWGLPNHLRMLAEQEQPTQRDVAGGPRVPKAPSSPLGNSGVGGGGGSGSSSGIAARRGMPRASVQFGGLGKERGAGGYSTGIGGSGIGGIGIGIGVPAAPAVANGMANVNFGPQEEARVEDGDEDDTFREIVDELTVQNKMLKTRLRRYEPSKQTKDLKRDRLFEVRFFEGLPRERRQELEGFLTSFVQSLHDPDRWRHLQASLSSSLPSSASRSMPSISPVDLSPAEKNQGPPSGDDAGGVPGEVQSGGSSVPMVKASTDDSLTSSTRQQKQQQTQHVPSADPTLGSATASTSVFAQPEPLHGFKRPRLSEQERLAAPSFSGFEPPSATGTGTCMRISPPHEMHADTWGTPTGVAESKKAKRKRAESQAEAAAGEAGVMADEASRETAQEIAAAVDRLFKDSAPGGIVGAPPNDSAGPFPLPKDAGTNQAYLRNLLEANRPAGGWVYLNLCFGMAQLHRFNVPMPFIRSALKHFAPNIELSQDGAKIRRVSTPPAPSLSPSRQATQEQEGEVGEVEGSASGYCSRRGAPAGPSSSKLGVGSGSRSGSSPSFAGSYAPYARFLRGMAPSTAAGGRTSTAPTSVVPSTTGPMQSSGHGGCGQSINRQHPLAQASGLSSPGERTSAGSSEPIVRGPMYDLIAEGKEGPALKRIRLSEPDVSKASSAYKPRFENTTSDSESASVAPGGLSSGSEPKDTLAARRNAAEGSVGFYAGGMFCTDMTYDWSYLRTRTGRAAEYYTVGLTSDGGYHDEDIGNSKERETLPLSSSKVLREQTPLQGSVGAIGAEEAEALKIELGSTDASQRPTIELEPLTATGMTNLVISDNFSLIVTMAYTRALEPPLRPARKRKYPALALSPAAELQERLRASRPGGDGRQRRRRPPLPPPPSRFQYAVRYERPISHLPSVRPRSLPHGFGPAEGSSDGDQSLSGECLESDDGYSGFGATDVGGPVVEAEAEAEAGARASAMAVRHPLAQPLGCEGDYALSLQMPYMWSAWSAPPRSLTRTSSDGSSAGNSSAQAAPSSRSRAPIDIDASTSG